MKDRQPIQKTSWAQVFIVLVFIAYIYLVIVTFKETFSKKPFDLFGLEKKEVVK